MESTSSNQTKFANKLQGKKVLILGGTSGIGFAVAEGALEFGAHVIISSSTPDKLEGAQTRLRKAYPDYADRVSGKTCDLSKPETLESNLRALLEFAGKGIHHIVHTAGDKLRQVPLSEATPELMQELSIVRFVSPVILAKLAPEYLVDGPESSITLTSGVGAKRPNPGRTILAAYGAGLQGLVRGLALDFQPVRVDLVAPGTIDTEIWASMPQGARQSFKKMTTTGALGRPEDIAEAYLYCMKDSFVTGSLITSDGGRSLL